MKRWLLISMAVLVVSCQNPLLFSPSSPSSGSSRGLTVSWHFAAASSRTTLAAASSRTILPTYETPTSYNVTLTPTSGSLITQTGLTGTSWSFTNIPPSQYAITVVGYYAGSPIVSGSGSANMTSSALADISIILYYTDTGTGTGQISLTFDFAAIGQTVNSASLQIVTPVGSTSSQIWTSINENKVVYTNASAQVGNYQFFLKASSDTNTAYRMESVVVEQYLSTSTTVGFTSADFRATYVPVTSLTLNKNSSTAVYDGRTDTLTATLNSAATNQLVVWSSSNPSYASVTQGGVVTILVPGPQTVTITAKSVENSLATASCTYTIPAVSVTLSPTIVTLEAGGAATTLTPTVANAVNTAVTWGTNNSGIATVSDGVVTPFAAGSATITATSVADPTKTATCAVIVVIANAQWAQTLTAGDNSAQFTGVAVDSSGNIYAAGYSHGTGTYDFGNGKTATGTSSGHNVLLVKYDSSGAAQWAQTLTAGTGDAFFNGVAVDSSGNVYAAGYSSGTGTYGFGNGKTATGTGSSGNVLLVKYNSSGTAQWAQTLTAGDGKPQFTAVAVDSSDNVYAAGSSFGTTTYGFGNGVTATGTSSSSNVLLVKYNSSGAAQWAQTLTAGDGKPQFTAVTVDSSGNVYAAGCSTGTTTYGFGNGKTATGTSDNNNVLLVKYDSSGAALWAQTLTSTGSVDAGFTSVAVDSSGNVYAAGSSYGTGTYGFGNGKTATGTSSSGSNVLLVKYDSSGAAQWAETLTAGDGGVYYYGVAVDNSGNVYAAGYSSGIATYGFGNGKTATGTATGHNVLLVKYDSSGAAQWAQTLTAGTGDAYFRGAAVDNSGNVYAAGCSTGTTTYGFDNGVTAAGTSSDNVLLVKYLN